MYIKIIGSLCLMLTATAVGFFKAELLCVRVKRLMELKRMMIFLQGELRVYKATLSEAFASVAERLEEPFGSALEKMALQMEQQNSPGFSAIWQEMEKKMLQEEGFLKEDEALFRMLQNSLGYLDLTMQTEALNLAIFQTDEAMKEAKEQQRVKGKLYKTMGVTAGAFLVLLIL